MSPRRTPASTLVSDLRREVLPRVYEAALDALAVLSPVACSGCGARDRSLCRSCRHALAPHPELVADGVASVPVWAALDYSGAPRAVLLAYKDHGRTDALPALARALHAAVAAALRQAPPAARAGGVVLVTVPSTRAAFRRRGYHPTKTILRRAGLRTAPARRSVRLARRVVDQAGLSVAERASNREGAFSASRALAGRACLVVDDIVTTGATLREMARAIEVAGGTVIGAAAVAHTRRRRTRT